jgi:hypothetical protein
MINITSKNIQEIEDGIKFFISNKGFLVKHTEHYPLQIDLAHHRFTVCSEKDIDDLIISIKSDIDSFNKLHNSFLGRLLLFFGLA